MLRGAAGGTAAAEPTALIRPGGYVFALLFSTGIGGALATDFTAVASTVDASVATISAATEAGSSLGSGFVVGGGSLIVTNWHVVKDGTRIHCRFPQGVTYDVLAVVARSTTTDLALLAIGGTQPSLSLAPGPVVPGIPVLAVGNPHGFGTSYTDGIVSGLRMVDGVGMVQHSAPISPGNSGGPLLNAAGQVIGVNTLAVVLEGSQNLNLSVSVTELRSFLAKFASLDPEVLVETQISGLVGDHLAVVPGLAGGGTTFARPAEMEACSHEAWVGAADRILSDGRPLYEGSAFRCSHLRRSDGVNWVVARFQLLADLAILDDYLAGELGAGFTRTRQGACSAEYRRDLVGAFGTRLPITLRLSAQNRIVYLVYEVELIPYAPKAAWIGMCDEARRALGR